ncbi:MAG: TIGR02757 family protein [Muribaculum sp.]|nr:TIGR02757 family protein [Muribaculaceae bacterium]MCM1080327.1 TIGR02757 family protein [Muribaculum sp.]
MDSTLKELLDFHASRINSTDFIANDPVQFPRRFSELADIEITALICSSIAWGNRKMICTDCAKLLALMDNSPYRYVMERGFDDLPSRKNIHRTFFTDNLTHFLRGLHAIYTSHPTLADFARSKAIHQSPLPAWQLAEEINAQLALANNGQSDSRCLPLNMRQTALKRLNMALRWLVRDDGIVDMGVWKGVIKPSQLFIPLDVHVGNTARQLGLLTRTAADRRAAVELTEQLRAVRPDDPVWYDYALFGIGIEHVLTQ